ncbi:MAG: MerR family transcriptional regulator [Eubacteriaceae bacterium]|jgi:DNA-binding transcriptional MerR regulator/DNA gyrase inhibitor GyrI|nr:MerR family transcriptional regulator [Eubacteriaceae bacterium]MDD4507667.1 MerR family transcriptional regulator [Eubacteriaceae bacterium]
MYSIGEFSKIGSVSTKTLRYYDEIGLIHPASVDQTTHYRYYAETQIDDILTILELKNLDLRLEQIKAVMENKDASLLKYFLNQRMEEINSEVDKKRQLYKRIEQKIQALQSGGKPMATENTLEVITKTFQPQWVMSRKETIVIDEIGTVIGQVFEAIFKNGLQPAGPVMTFYLDEEFNHDHAAIEVCIPVSKHIEGIKGMKWLEPGLCAMCTYYGVYSKLGKAYASVLKWIEDHSYHIASAPFDCYLNDPAAVKDPEDLITQVWFPIAK